MILIKTLIFWSLALLLYTVLRRYIEHPTHKRYLLLGIIIGGLLINVPLPYFNSVDRTLISINLPEIQAVSSAASSAWLDWTFVWNIVYTVVTAIFGLLFILEIAQLLNLLKQAVKTDEYYLLPESEDIFSFMGRIFVGDQLRLSGEEMHMALFHEKQHVKRGHSFDLMLLSTLQIIFWFFPIWPWLRKELQLVHELEADQEVIIKYNAHQYAGLLVRLSIQVNLSSVHYFAQFVTKKRLQAMIHSNKTSVIRPMIGILLLGLIWLFVACADEQENIVSKSNIDHSKTSNAQGSELKSVESDVLRVAEVMPVLEVCKGVEKGMMCLIEKFYEFVKYPESARKEGLEGTAVVSFVVDLNGNVRDIQLVKKVAPSIDQAAEQAFRAFAENYKWVPGRQDGKDVKVRLNLPIKFKLDDK